MSSAELRIAEAITSLTNRLTSWGVEDPRDKAHEFVSDMLRNGWRTTPNAIEPPPRATPARDEVREQALANMRQAVAAAKVQQMPHGGEEEA